MRRRTNLHDDPALAGPGDLDVREQEAPAAGHVHPVDAEVSDAAVRDSTPFAVVEHRPVTAAVLNVDPGERHVLGVVNMKHRSSGHGQHRPAARCRRDAPGGRVDQQQQRAAELADDVFARRIELRDEVVDVEPPVRPAPPLAVRRVRRRVDRADCQRAGVDPDHRLVDVRPPVAAP